MAGVEQEWLGAGANRNRWQIYAEICNLSLKDDAVHVNPNGDIIAIGHPLGA